MKIMFKQIAKIGAAVLMSGGVIYGVYDAVKDGKNYKDIYDLQNEIKLKDPQRYDSLKNNQPMRRSYEEWKYELRLMNEAIKTDSLVKSAYFKGAQMVRDSLKNVNKAIK